MTPENVGIMVGKVWHALNSNGASTITKLQELCGDESEKATKDLIIASLGCLMKEGKIISDDGKKFTLAY
jgi:hypothetical protein